MNDSSKVSFNTKGKALNTYDAIVIGSGISGGMVLRIVKRFILLLTYSLCSLNITYAQKPNILFILIDDMGYGDLGCYGNTEVTTPNIDQLATEGIRLAQYYVNSPICSPSRTAMLTGQYPSRWGITSYIDSRAQNQLRGMSDFLDTNAPSVANMLQQAGYYTAHVGKWHMGGGRDVGEAPLITEYGFNESVTQFEGLGERYLATYETLPNLKDSTRNLENMSARLGNGEVHWAKRENFTEIFVSRTIDAIQRARETGKPFYINLWPDDIHTPLEPVKELRGDLSTKARFLGVMAEMDRHMGRLFEYIRNDPSLKSNTLIIFTSDNGPDGQVNKAANLRGSKTNLYEGGIREPFIVWWPGRIPADLNGTVNEKTVMAAVDLMPTFLQVAGIKSRSDISNDGIDMSEAITGQAKPARSKPLFWIRPPDRPGYDGDNAPDLAIRKGDYKLLMDVDGSSVQLYDIVKDPRENKNLASTQSDIAKQLKDELMLWYNDYPHKIDKRIYERALR